MPMGGLGSLAGGLAQGLSLGIQTRKAQMELKQLQDAQNALKARQKTLLSQLQGETDAFVGGGAGGGPMAPPPPGAQPSGPNLGPPAAPTQGDQPPQGPGGPPAGPPPMAAQLQTLSGQGPPSQNQPATGPSPAPAPQTPPQGPTPPTQAPGGALGASGADSGLPPGFNPQAVAQTYKQLKKLALDDYRSVAQDIKNANPGKKWKPTEFINAVDAEFKQRSQLSPDLKEAVLAESQAARAQASYMQAQVRAYQSQERIDQGATKISDQEQKTAWYEHYSEANADERRRMDTFRQSHANEVQHDLEKFRDWEEQHGNTMAGVAQGRLAKAPDNSAGGGQGNARLARILAGNPVGKNYLQAQTFKNQIDALADDPGTATNPAAQLDLIDAAVRQASGGVARKAQFDAIAKRNGFTDFLAMHSYLADGRGIIGPKIIEDIRKSADEQANAAMEAGRKMFPNETAQLEGRAPAGGGGGGQGGAGSSRANPVHPATKAEAMKLPRGTWFTDPSGNVLQKA